MKLRVALEFSLLLAHLDVIAYNLACSVRQLRLLLRFPGLIGWRNQQEQAQLFVALKMNPVEDPGWKAQNAIKASDGIVESLQARIEHASIIVIGEDLDGFSASLDFSSRLLNQFECVLVALGLEAELGKAAVEASHLLRV